MADTYWSFRITLSDRPGGLADVAAALADLGVNVLDVDVHLVECEGLERADIADDVIVELPYWLDPAIVEAGLRGAGVPEVLARRIDPHELVDSQARALELARSLVATGASDSDLGAALCTLLGTSVVWLGPADGLATAGVADEARRRGHPVVGREWVKRLPSGTGSPPWVLAVPWGRDLGRVAVAARRSSRFTSTEIARARALLDFVATMRTIGSTHVPGPPR